MTARPHPGALLRPHPRLSHQHMDVLRHMRSMVIPQQLVEIAEALHPAPAQARDIEHTRDLITDLVRMGRVRSARDAEGYKHYELVIGAADDGPAAPPTPPPQLDRVHGPVYRPARGPVLRAGSQDFLRIASRGLLRGASHAA